MRNFCYVFAIVSRIGNLRYGKDFLLERCV